MNLVVGFSIFSELSEHNIRALHAAQENAMKHFSYLQKQSLVVGETHLEVWGRKGMDECVHPLPDGSFVVLIGSPHSKVDFGDLTDKLLSDDFVIPWDGRVIVLRISADGKHWTIWNDWLGSIPVFYAKLGQGRIASTLEPVTVAAAGYTPNDFFLSGLVSLLMNGHFISDWSLYRDMKIIPPDSKIDWDEKGFRANRLWTILPTQNRWEASWDDLVDEMHELSYRAIADVLRTQSSWILPLSSGLDSRLIAAVGADLGANFHAYAWGEPESTDVIYSRQIAKTLGLPWKRIDLSEDFLSKYTSQWADLFGSSMHFHGMYQMSFLDALKSEPDGSLVNGYIGDVLDGSSLMKYDEGSVIYKKEWYVRWNEKDIKSFLSFPVDDCLLDIVQEVRKLSDSIRGAQFAKTLLFELWSRQRLFTSFQSTLASYWREVATPFLNRDYARFCLSLPRAVHEDRRLLGDVFRRYYGRLAVIPGTYASDPFILTGRYLLLRRIAEFLLPAFHHGPLKGFGDVQLRMDVTSIRTNGTDALWPLFEVKDRLSEWVDFKFLEKDFQTIMQTKEDILPLRRLQAVQALAYRLL